ncbi:ArsR/SmtB family transcription factor [Paenibacillus eucommiae]|uniref:DNA-binding transcriptional ArsR family regulator n=1 Tax=Paenibacillus eucommiae TaxID=1355755 RepID=A0ABS4IYK7_9BACL|nr:metalloregulator ArsR/SmtB family transcription factor [Paenibacillus eucommiae]MBP1992676.1 DNA-binding transcriptional ArsR family regulator [Paenibacillus eucommiae]
MAEPKHDVFQAIADPTRRGLLKLLGDQEMPVTLISGHFPMSRTAVSKHLRILADAGLVRERKVGRETRYRLDPEPLMELKRWLAYYEQYWGNKMAALKLFVESDDPAGAFAPVRLEAVERKSDSSGPSPPK